MENSIKISASGGPPLTLIRLGGVYCQSEGVVARADYGIPVCEWWVGGPPKLFLSSSSFFFLSGQVMVLVS